MTIIAQLSDIHISADPSGRVDDTSGPVRALRAAVSSLLSLPARPDCLVLTGDLVENGLPAEYARLHALLSPLPMPVYPLPGNHDDRDALREVFSEHDAVRETGHTPEAPLQYAVEIAGTRLVCCDSTVPGKSHGDLDAARLEWLDATLAEVPGLPTVVATHHPPFTVGLGFIDELSLSDPAAFAAVIQRHDHVVRIISGHVHRNAVSSVGGVVCTTCPSTYRQLYLDLSRPGQAAWTGEPAGFALHVINSDGTAVTHYSPTGSYRPLMDAL